MAAGKKAAFEGAYAGFARLQVPRAGRYRVSLNQSGWIDLVAGDGVVPAADFSGGTGCSTPGKVVVFELPAGAVLLQLTGVRAERIRLTLTHAPDG